MAGEGDDRSRAPAWPPSELEAAAVESDDAETMHQETHALKGMLGSYASRHAVALAAAVDLLARGGDVAGANEKLPALRGATERLGEALRTYVEEIGS